MLTRETLCQIYQKVFKLLFGGFLDAFRFSPVSYIKQPGDALPIWPVAAAWSAFTPSTKLGQLHKNIATVTTHPKPMDTKSRRHNKSATAESPNENTSNRGKGRQNSDSPDPAL